MTPAVPRADGTTGGTAPAPSPVVPRSTGWKPTTPCTEWTKARGVEGYGRLGRDGRTWLAHRWVMAQIHGAAALAGKVVMHHCDNKGCVNPEHLSIADYGDNIRDAYAKGLQPPRDHAGEAHPQHKLTEDEVREIRALDLSERGSAKAAAAAYGVDPCTINDIRARRTWRHI